MNSLPHMTPSVSNPAPASAWSRFVRNPPRVAFSFSLLLLVIGSFININQKRHFEFVHGHGLGVLAVGTKIAKDLSFLFEADEKETHLIRNFFYQLGSRIEHSRQFHEQQKYIEELQTYEKVVRNSRTMRIYRILKEEGLMKRLKIKS